MQPNQNIPSWAVPAGAKPKASQASPPAATSPQKSPTNGVVSYVVSKLKDASNAVSNSIGSFFGKKPALQSTPLPSWAVPKGAKSAPVASKPAQQTTPAPSWAVPIKKASVGENEAEIPSGFPQKKTFDVSKAKPLGNLFQDVTPATEDSTVATKTSTPLLDTNKNQVVEPGINPADFVTSLPESVKDTVIGVGQSLNRTAAELAISIGQAALAHTKYASVMTGGFTPSDEMSKGLFGTSDLKGLSFQVAELEQKIKNSDFAKSIGLSKYALPLAFGGVIGGETLNFLPGSPEENEIVKGLVDAVTPDEAAAVLRKTGISEGLVQDLAPKFAKMTDKQQVRDALGIVGQIHAAIGAQDVLGALNSQEIDKIIATEAEGYEVVPTDEEGRPLPQKETPPQGREVGTGKIGDQEVQIKKGGEIGLSPAEKEAIAAETRKKFGLAPETMGDIPYAPKEPEFQVTNPGEDSSTVKPINSLSKAIAQSTDPAEIAKMLENTGVSKDEIPALSKQLAKVDSPSKVFSMIEGFDITPRTQAPLSPELEQKKLEIQMKAETLKNSPFANEANRLMVDREGSVRELGDTKGKLSRRIEDRMAEAGVRDAGDFSAGLENYFNKKKELEDMKKQFSADKAKYLQSQKPAPFVPQNLPTPEEIKFNDQIASIFRAGRDEMMKDIAAVPNDQLSAIAESKDGGLISGPFKGWRPETVKAFQNWVNRRKMDSRQMAAAIIRKMVEPLRSAGVEGILRLEGYYFDEHLGMAVQLPDGKPESSGVYGQYRQIEDAIFWEAKRSGIPIQYKENHVRIYYKDPASNDIVDGETGKVIGNESKKLKQELGTGRRVGLHPGFAQHRVFRNNAEVINAGYKLAFPNAPDILFQYVMEVEKAIADRDFFTYLTRTGNAVPEPAVLPEAQSEMASYNPDRFPKHKFNYRDYLENTEKQYTGTFKGPKAVVQKVNQYLEDPNEFWRKFSKFSGSVKNIALSIGIPKTGLSLHFMNIAPRDITNSIAQSIYSKSPTLALKETARMLSYGFWTDSARKYVLNHMEEMLPYVRAGMTFSSEEHNVDALDLSGDKTTMEKAGAVGKYVSEKMHEAFAKGVFSRIIPARKMFWAPKFFEQAVKNGATQDEAYRWAALKVNEIYGGINWEQWGRNRTTQAVMRSLFIAPDFAETNYRIGKGVVSGTLGRLFGKAESATQDNFLKAGSAQSKYYTNFALAFIGLWIASNIINYESKGDGMWSNNPLYQDAIAFGKDAMGKTRYLKPFGTGFDWYRIPAQIVSALIQNKPNDVMAVLRNRLSIPLADAISITFNTDWSGQRIYGPDLYGNPQSTATQLTNVFNNTIGSFAPGSFTGLEGYLSGRNSGEQTATQLIGLPVAYRNEKPNMTDIKQLEADAKAGIANGDYTLYNKLVEAKVIAPRSRSAFIRSALTGAKTARQQRASAKSKAKLSAEETALQDEGFTK